MSGTLTNEVDKWAARVVQCTPQRTVLLTGVRMIFSTTEMSNYNRCNRMWILTSFNGQGLSRIVHNVALSTGTLWHQTQASWLLNPDEDPELLCLGHFQIMLEQAKEQYYQRHGMRPNRIEMANIEEAGTMVRAMTKNYRDYYGKPLPDGFRSIMPEQTILVPIPNSSQPCEDCSTSGRVIQTLNGLIPVGPYEPDSIVCPGCNGVGVVTHQLECTFDALLANERDRLYVLERKTYGSRPKLESLMTNFQFIVYEWASATLGLGPVGGLLYDGAWKRAQPPKGRTMDDLFLRLPLERNTHELEEIEQYLAMKSKQMYTTIKTGTPLLDFNRRWDGCYDCSVEDICTAMSKGEDVQYVREHFFTLRERTPAFVSQDQD